MWALSFNNWSIVVFSLCFWVRLSTRACHAWLPSIALRTKVSALILRCYGTAIAWKATFAKLLSCLMVNSMCHCLSVTTIIGNTVVIICRHIWKKTIAASPSNKIPFGLADRDVGFVQPLYVIYQSFYIANQKLTWLILMKAFNILSNLLQYSISFPTNCSS